MSINDDPAATPQPTQTIVPYPRIASPVDFNGNGIDDYTDMLAGARHDAESRPRYDAVWVQGGYPADDVGVCTDLIWRAFAAAGYNLKEMVDRDIAANVSLYPGVEDVPDPSIDFRRTINLKVFLNVMPNR